MLRLRSWGVLAVSMGGVAVACSGSARQFSTSSTSTAGQNGETQGSSGERSAGGDTDTTAAGRGGDDAVIGGEIGAGAVPGGGGAGEDASVPVVAGSGGEATEALPVCGNGVLETGEGCDDGGKVSSDGCSATCGVEGGFACHGAPSNCFEPGPSCAGLPETCGVDGNTSCCSSSVVPGGTFNRDHDPAYPATISSFRLDTFEITVGRFRKFWSGFPANLPAAGSGKNSNQPADTGWSSDWNANLPATKNALSTAIECEADYQTWTAGDDNLPMNCLSWYEAQAFCIWDGGRLPTEAEWAFAASGGAEQRPYAWGADAPKADANRAIWGCYYPDGSGTCSSVANIAPVGSVSGGNGRWGQADLLGSIYEWTLDTWSEQYLTPCVNCAQLAPETERATRGGNFRSPATVPLRIITSSRGHLGGTNHAGGTGARCARNL